MKEEVKRLYMTMLEVETARRAWLLEQRIKADLAGLGLLESGLGQSLPSVESPEKTQGGG